MPATKTPDDGSSDSAILRGEGMNPAPALFALWERPK